MPATFDPLRSQPEVDGELLSLFEAEGHDTLESVQAARRPQSRLAGLRVITDDMGHPSSRARRAPSRAATLAWVVSCVVVATSACGGSHERSPRDGGGSADGAERVADAGGRADAAVPDRVVPGFDVHRVAAAPLEPYGLGLEPELAIDRAGVFHLAHVHQDTGDVLYTHGTIGVFETERAGTIALEPTDAGAAALWLGDGVAHLVWTHEAELGATWARRAGDGSWSLEALPFDAGPLDGRHPDVIGLPDGTLAFLGTARSAIGSLDAVARLGAGPVERIGEAHDWRGLAIRAVASGEGAVYATIDSVGGVILATRSADGAWSTQAIERARASSLAMGPDGTVALALARDLEPSGSGSVVLLARGPAIAEAIAAGALTEVARNERRIQRTSLAIGRGGAAHVAYEIAGTVYYATDEGGGWRSPMVEFVSTQNGRPSIALDPDGVAWIAYRDGDGALVLATPWR